MVPLRRPLLFGEVLYDCFPDGSRVLGGAPFNVAWHLRALGLDPLVVSRVGDDAPGRLVLEAMGRWSLDATGMQRDADSPTGQVVVRIEDAEPHFHIVPGQAYDRIEPPAVPLPDVGLLYHGTLALRAEASRASLFHLRESLAAPVFIDVNLRDPWWSATLVAKTLDGARWCKLNEIELRRLAGAGDPGRAAARLIADHGLERVFVTLGAAGAFALAADGEYHAVAPWPGIAIIDTVGAGDAFSAAVITGLLGGWPMEVALGRAQQLASAVCSLRGAVAASHVFYQQVFARWDSD